MSIISAHLADKIISVVTVMALDRYAAAAVARAVASDALTGMALMVRVGAESREQALREPHVRSMLFAGRVLSGFICIEPEGYAADDALADWVRRGLDFVSGLPVKPVRASS